MARISWPQFVTARDRALKRRRTITVSCDSTGSALCEAGDTDTNSGTSSQLGEEEDDVEKGSRGMSEGESQ